jgi:SAM-dependent methyltransferase
MTSNEFSGGTGLAAGILEPWAPMVDTTGASSARLWNLAQGGKDSYAADRRLFAGIKEIAPQFSDLAKANQEFLLSACQHLAGELGIAQYVDCGPGLPVGERLHDIVQAIRPIAKVLYVDNDRAVLSHARTFVGGNDCVRVVPGDIFAPEELLRSEDVNAFIDWSEPVAIIQTATLHHHSGDASDLVRTMQTFVDAAAPGSCTVISHFLDPEDAATDAVRRIEKQLLDSAIGTGWFRTLDEIRSLFPDQDLLDPGVVACHQWPRPNTEEPDSIAETTNWIRACIAGGIGQKRAGH